MLCTSMECEGGLTDRSTDKLVREAAGFGPCALMDRSTDKLTDRLPREAAGFGTCALTNRLTDRLTDRLVREAPGFNAQVPNPEASLTNLSVDLSVNARVRDLCVDGQVDGQISFDLKMTPSDFGVCVHMHWVRAVSAQCQASQSSSAPRDVAMGRRRMNNSCPGAAAMDSRLLTGEEKARISAALDVELLRVDYLLGLANFCSEDNSVSDMVQAYITEARSELGASLCSRQAVLAMLFVKLALAICIGRTRQYLLATERSLRDVVILRTQLTIPIGDRNIFLQTLDKDAFCGQLSRRDESALLHSYRKVR